MMVKKIMQLPVCAPRVDRWMLKPEYWIKKTVNAGQIIFNADQVMRFNEKTFQKVKSKGFEEWLYHLENYPDAVSRSDLLNIMKAHSSKEAFPSKTYYDIHGQKIPETSRREILKQVNLEKINEENPVKWGMLIKREDVRAFPTDMVFAEKPEEFDFDLFQLTILPAASPVAILHHSHDSQWVYVQSRICKGWLKAESVALAKDKKDIFDYLHSEHFLIITESRVETEPNPFVSEISNILFQMGDRIPLIDFHKIPESIPLHCKHAQSPQGCYVVKVPVKDKNGYLRFEPALIARSNDVSEGYLAYTRKNILRQAFKLLGERYGWNGMFTRRDCAQFIMNVYRTMNVQLPVFTWIQEKGAAGTILKFPGPIEQREQLLNQLHPGDPIHLKGHVVMYLGNTGKNHYILHAAGGYGIKDENDRLKPVTVHGIFVSEVHQWMMNQRKSYLEAFTTALKYQ